MVNKSDISKAIFLSVFAMACFSLSDILRKFVSQNYDILDILFWQGVFGFSVVLIVAPFMGGVKSLLNKETMKWHILRGVLIALNTFLSLMAISRVPLLDAYTIFFLSPFVVSLMGVVFLKEAIGRFRLMSILAGFVGAFIAFRPGFEAINFAYIYAFICVFTFSSASILARYIGRANGLLPFVFWPFLILISGILVYQGGTIRFDFPAPFFVYAMFMGTAYGVALIALVLSYTFAPASLVAPYQYIQIIFAVLFGYFLFGDVPDIFKIIGASVIVGAGIVLFVRERMNDPKSL